MHISFFKNPRGLFILYLVREAFHSYSQTSAFWVTSKKSGVLHFTVSL